MLEFWVNVFQIVVSQSPTSIQPRNLPKIQIQRTVLRPSESESLGMKTNNLYMINSKSFCICSSLGKFSLSTTQSVVYRITTALLESLLKRQKYEPLQTY